MHEWCIGGVLVVLVYYGVAWARVSRILRFTDHIHPLIRVAYCNSADIVTGLLPEIITAIIAVLIYWIKRSIDNGLDEVKTSLTNINNIKRENLRLINAIGYL